MIKERLQQQDYNLRERANIYLGTALGFLAPIVAGRYLISTTPGNSSEEAAAWAASAIMNLGASVALSGFPLLYSVGAGALLGTARARNLRDKRQQKERELEKKLQ